MLIGKPVRRIESIVDLRLGIGAVAAAGTCFKTKVSSGSGRGVAG
jgi:hypothetical protein